MYQKYQTEAIVLANREMGENDRVVALYTKDFGLVKARASAIRSEKSKMRYALQDYSHASVSLVKGRRGWRAAGAIALRCALQKPPERVAAFARVSALTMRFIAGEEESPYLFAALAEAHEALLSDGTGLSWATIEIVCAARILFALGYLSTEALQTALFHETGYAPAQLEEAETLRDQLLWSINRAIAETHL